MTYTQKTHEESDESKYLCFVRSKQLCSFLIQGIIRIRLIEEVYESVDDRVDVKHGLPVLAQDVETDRAG